MSAGHTPGPWRTVQYATGQKALTVEASGVPLLKMYAGRNEVANARLIAAAPELLALLIRYRNETPAGHSPHMICHLADAVIARATGAA